MSKKDRSSHVGHGALEMAVESGGRATLHLHHFLDRHVRDGLKHAMRERDD